MKRITLYLILILIKVNLYSQIVNNFGYPKIQNYSVENYNASEQNWYIVPDNRGIMYFANTDGVLEFDGKNWNLYPVSNLSPVRSIAVDKKGIIYVGASEEFGYLEPNKQGTLKYHSLSSQLDSVVTSNTIWKIYINNDKVYYCSQNYIYIFKNKHFEKIIKLEGFAPFSFWINDRLYLISNELGLHELFNDSLKLAIGSQLFRQEYISNIIDCNDGKVLVCSQKSGIWKYDSKTGIIENFIDPIVNEILKSNQLYTSAKNKNYFFFGTIGDGIFVVDLKGKLIYHLTKDNGLNSDQVTYLYANDFEVWCAFYFNGLSKIEFGVPFSTCDNKLGIDGNINDIIISNNNLYLATSKGINYACIGNQFPLNFQSVNDPDNAWNFLNYKNDYISRLLFSSTSGIFEIQKDKTIDHLEIEGFEDVNVTRIYQGVFEKNDIIAGKPSGLYIINENNQKFRLKSILNQYFKSEIYKVTELKRNDLWITPNTNGIFRIQMRENDTLATFYSKKQGLPMVELNNVYSINNKIIAATSKGVYEYNENSDSFTLSNLFGDAFRTSEKKLQEIFPLTDSTFYISYIEKKDIENKNLKIIFLSRNYNGDIKIDSIPYKYLSSKNVYPVVYSDSLYTLFGLGEKLYQYNRNNTFDFYKKYPVLIRKIKSGDSLIFNGNFYTDSVINLDSTIYISKKQSSNQIPILNFQFNNITFNVTAPYFIQEDRTEYSYFLEGDDKKWSPWTSETKYVKTNLTEGHYIFKAKARNVFGIESEVAEYAFTILPPWYRTIWAYAIYFILLLLFVWFIVRWNTRRLIKDKIRLEQIVEERTAEIRQQKDEISEQRDEIERQRDVVIIQRDKIAQQKMDIEDSIVYAQRIQKAVIPPLELIQHYFSEHFVLFKPRDIVSGDFYWFRQVGDYVIITAADCTGHGVPGAFMSLLGISYLNEITSSRKVLSAAEILNELRKEIKSSLRQKDINSETKDGMDISLCVINLTKMEMQFAGAYNSLYFIRNNELTQILADKMPVGVHIKQDSSFTNHEIKLEKGDVIYFYSDGYADQIGGPGNKKFMKKQFRDLLFDNHLKPMTEQKEILLKTLTKWQGANNQLDDITVIGIRF